MSDSKNGRQADMTELGAKIRAGTLMSSLLRAVASEQTELISIKVPGRKDGKMTTKLVSKAEAIVRDMVEQALPHKLEDGELFDSKVQMEYRKMILDRVDGRAGTVGDDGNRDSGESVPDKVSRVNKDYLNAKAKEATEKTEGKSKPPTV